MILIIMIIVLLITINKYKNIQKIYYEQVFKYYQKPRHKYMSGYSYDFSTFNYFLIDLAFVAVTNLLKIKLIR